MRKDEIDDTFYLDKEQVCTTPEQATRALARVLWKREHGSFFCTGVPTKCQGPSCQELVFIESKIDLELFKKRELLCTRCERELFYAKTPLEREQIQRENARIIREAILDMRCGITKLF